MDYKEKYEQGLECIQEILSSGQEKIKMTLLKERLQPFFPELSESEDELTWLTKFIEEEETYSLSMDIRDNEDRIRLKNLQKSLAWLEKQKAMDKEIVFRPLIGTDIRVAAKQALEKIEIGKKVVLAFNGAYIPVNDKTVSKICDEYDAWLEKQGKNLENYDEAEKEKAGFVGDGFIECQADFLDFKEGNTYWLEYIGDDKYNVRSDNLLGKTYHITPCQLYTIFKKQTWLEKQRISVKECLNLPHFTFDDVLALQCCMETVKKVQEDKELYEQLQNLHNRLHDAYWLEKQGNCSAKWQDNTPDNKPAINHSVLMKTTQGIAEGYFAGNLWFQFRWSSNIKDSDVLAWMELSDLDKQDINQT